MVTLYSQFGRKSVSYCTFSLYEDDSIITFFVPKKTFEVVKILKALKDVIIIIFIELTGCVAGI